ncbi:DUF3158 family protein [Aggregatibacter actinomycetemcomitans]|uniref:DUF3158 family protein n=1 Tax=Aggregatibacter actinomycetemcomitans TaxID=714 RepID=UPI00197B2D7C|nr:DUF3158 family protein [Aggregatibacter actinomycetemcomitans]MBN6079244.1 DUF3158 family protein [Aggregatibacter actinomycetemcomitans]
MSLLSIQYIQLSDADFQAFHRSAPVNASLRNVFRKMSSADDYQLLSQYVQQTRDALMSLQKKIIDAANSYPLTHLPIYLKKDVSSGGCFLRWRNCDNNRQGQPAWEEIIQDKNVPIEIREAMLAVEKDRICANMQMAVLNSILRQSRECEGKLVIAEKLFKKALE